MLIQVDMEPGEESKAYDAVRVILEQLSTVDPRVAKAYQHVLAEDYIAGMPDACKSVIAEIDDYLESES